MKSALISKIKKKQWYRQGGSILPYYVWQPYKRAFEYYDGFNYFAGKINYGYFNKKKQKKICDDILKRQMKNNSYLSKKLIEPWKKLAKKQREFNAIITKEHLQQLDEKQFLKLHKEFIKIRYKHWKYSVLIETFDPWGDLLVSDFMQKNKLDIAAEDLNVLMDQQKLHFIQMEKLDRLRIAKKLKLGKAKPQDIPEHIKKYFWIHNSWAEVYYLDGAFFLELIKRDISKDTEKIDRTIKWFDGFASYQKEKKAELYKKYKLDAKAINMFSFFSMLTDWRDGRKALAYQSNYTGDLFLHELSTRTGVRHYLLTYLSPHEIKSFSTVKKLKSTLLQRSRGCIYYQHPKTVEWFMAKDAEEMRQLLDNRIGNSKELKGVCASKGKATGKAKIIMTKDDFDKLKQGDILVTSMTRPEHTPIMKKAAAIVTDEGGITCHAAIVSRELGVPCIIGTQSATNVLKDNDLIEVDANKGIVRKI